MAQAKNLPRRAIPAWALVTIAALAIVILGFYGWRALAGYDTVDGPRKKVYPGMYDLRAEVAKRNAMQATGERRHGP
jgi:hypothetical protein